MVAVRLVKIDARRVLNLTSPRADAAIVQNWRGRHDWHDPRYDPVRDLMERTYIAAFNAANGHYERLEADILLNGVRNPVMLVSGQVQRRRRSELPPQWRGHPDLLVSEYLGGSRLYIAQKHGLEVPAIVNDFGELFPDAPRIRSIEDIAKCFDKRPGTITFSEDQGAYVNDMVYSHMPAGYSLAAQVPVRAAIVMTMRAAVNEWLLSNDV